MGGIFMRRTIALLSVSVVAGAMLAPVAAPASPNAGDPGPAQRDALRAGLQVAGKTGTPSKAPAGANPYLALLPDPAKADYAGWRQYLKARGAQRAAAKAQQRALASPLLADELEPNDRFGLNDTPATGERVPGFGTGSGKNPKARVLGTLSPESIELVAVPPNAEDDGSIPLAGDTGIGASRDGISTSATIGDGPHGSAGSGSGDFDFYKFDVAAGETLTVDIDTPVGSLDSVVVVFDPAGEIVAANDDSNGLDSFLTHQFSAAGTFYLMVAGFLSLPTDPNDSGSGEGAESEGQYDLKLSAGFADTDFYSFYLRKGDVLGASVSGSAAHIAVFDTVPREVHGSAQDASFIYSINTPLPGGGNAVTDYVAEKTGWHFIGISDGAGDYDVTVEAYRAPLAGTGKVQTLYLDFDGARLNTAIFGGSGVRTLSPLRAFLSSWGLTAADEDAVIDRVISTVRENIKLDLAASGLNGKFDVRILNSRDHGEQFGKANVSRVIVGGTIDESGVSTIGIAQSIDVGNFDTKESALVLLDVLSGPSGDDASLNTYITPASNKVQFVGRALGNIAAHEAGHFFGDWHVDQFNDQPNLMDQGGNFPVMFAVGPDGVGGTADDTDVDFGEDIFNPSEGFTGVEDTLSRLAFVLTK